VPVSRLAPGQQTLVSIARALATNADLIVMDEPTAYAHRPGDRAAVRRDAHAAGSAGWACVYISHRLAEIFAHHPAHHRDAQRARGDDAAGGSRWTEAGLVQWMTGPRRRRDLPGAHGPPPAQPLLTVTGLSGAFCRDITFTLHAGEVLGVAGLMGAGRSELLAHALWRRARDRRCEMVLHDDGVSASSIRPRSPADSLSAGAGAGAGGAAHPRAWCWRGRSSRTRR
jgi:ribose transport system ATP-binding protein